MSEPKFTPGPWAVGESDLGESVPVWAVNADGSTRTEIGLVNNYDDFPCLDEEAECEDVDMEARANARLICAAPDLYAAAIELLESTPVFNDAASKLKLALAKARGES